LRDRGGSQFKASPGKELARPHLNQWAGSSSVHLWSQLGQVGGLRSEASPRQKHETLPEKKKTETKRATAQQVWSPEFELQHCQNKWMNHKIVFGRQVFSHVEFRVRKDRKVKGGI
jgi:hypothetical protein